jgi:hypothetical protein
MFLFENIHEGNTIILFYFFPKAFNFFLNNKYMQLPYGTKRMTRFGGQIIDILL